MTTLGKHLIIELYNCDRKLIDDPGYIESALLEAVKISGATVIGTVFHKYAPQGVTGVVVVAESHFSIHTWPEYGYCAVDIFTCGETVKPEKAKNFLFSSLAAHQIDCTMHSRGDLSSFKI